MQLQFQISGSCDRPITADVTFDPKRSHQPVLIFAHGFKGFKDWGHFNLLAQLLSSQGIVTVKFNFSYNGTDPTNPVDITDPDAFGRNNLSTELNDMGLVIDAVYRKAAPLAQANIDPASLILMGHSRGGGSVILKAAEDARVKKLITLAALSEFGVFFSKNDIERWRTDGVMHVINYRTGQRLPMYKQYLDDFELHRDRLDIPARAAEVAVPWLCVHGTADQTVSVDHAYRLKSINPNLELLLVKDASHTFGGSHPFSRSAMPDLSWVQRIFSFIKAG